MAGVRASGRVVLLIAVVGGILAMALWPETLEVDTAVISRGSLVVTVDEEGRTRVRDRFVVSAPLGGRVLRIELEPGDRVRRGDVVARVDAGAPPLLDVRARADMEAAVNGARAVRERAQAEEQRARAALALAEREVLRSRTLAAAGALPAQDADARETEAQLAGEAVSAAAAAVRAATAELERALVPLAAPSPQTRASVVPVRAPVDGTILRRLRESESVVPPGEPLVEIGDPAKLEIVADLLSTDAVRVTVGARATIEQWGGAAPLGATITRIEPSGFTKISALGVEEQRVNVILALADQASEDAVLGDGYRVEVRIVVWEADHVLKVPTSALFRDGERWAVYVVNEGRARRTFVEIGRQTGREAEVLSGLPEGAQVIVHPGDLIRDGVRVREFARG